MKKLISLLLLLSFYANAGLPPTSIQGQYDSSPKTKFNFQLPYNQLTDLGGTKALLETGNKNLLVNPSFENTVFDFNWTSANYALKAVDTVNFIDGKQAYDASASLSQATLTQDVTPSIQTNAVAMEASCRVKTQLTNMQVCSRTGGTNGNCTTVPATNTWQYVPVNFNGPPNGTSVGVQVGMTSSSTGQFLVDDCYVGPARNIGTVLQTQEIGSMTISGCSADFQTANTSYSALSVSGCTYTPSGQAQSAGGTGAQLKFSSLAAGTYYLMAESAFYAQGAAGEAYFQFTDGTNTAREQSRVYTNATVATGTPSISQSIVYSTAQSNVTFSLNAKADSGVTAGVQAGSRGPLVIKVLYVPSSAQTAISLNAIQNPTITTITTSGCTPSTRCSGSNYIPPANVSYLEIEMAGGGGGGGGSGTSPGTATAGGNTTFGSSLLTANGGLGAGTGGAIGTGGTATIGTGATGFTLAGGNGGIGAAVINSNGPYGGSNPFGGAGYGGSSQPGAGGAGVPNTGGGGGGGGIGSAGGSAGAGGAGGWLHALITNTSSAWVSSFPFSVGAGGTGASAGTSGAAGGNGGAGSVRLIEHYANDLPILPNSVTSNSSGTERIERVNVTSVCSSTPCTINSQSGSWVSSISRSSTGTYTVNIVSGEFSAAPICTCVAHQQSNAFAGCVYNGVATSTSVPLQIMNGSNTLVDYPFEIICMGPH